MSRLLRSTVPTTKPQREPRYIDPVAMLNKDTVNKERQKRNFDAQQGVRELPHLQPGDPVWLPEKQVNGEVNTKVAPQSFTIDSDVGTYTAGTEKTSSVCLILSSTTVARWLHPPRPHHYAGAAASHNHQSE